MVTGNYTVKSGDANICLTYFPYTMISTRRCLLSIFFKFSSEYVILSNVENLQRNWAYQRQFYDHNISLLVKNKCSIKNSTEAVSVTNKETGRGGIADE